MPEVRFNIAGLDIPLCNPEQSLARLERLYAELGARLDNYRADGRNTVLCRAGCSHCCRSGGFFAMTLVEALRLNRAVSAVPESLASEMRSAAAKLHAKQRE